MGNDVVGGERNISEPVRPETIIKYQELIHALAMYDVSPKQLKKIAGSFSKRRYNE